MTQDHPVDEDLLGESGPSDPESAAKPARIGEGTTIAEDAAVTGNADISGETAMTPEYLQQVLRDIDEEVRRRRAAGDFPPSFERKLDEMFARFTPTGTDDNQFVEALKLADRSAYFDTKVPIGSRKTAKGAVRYALWQAEAWFLNYVVVQLNHFSSSTMRVMHLIDERLSDVEGDVAALVPPPLAVAGVDVPAPDMTPFLEAVVSRVVVGAGTARQSTTAHSGPVGRVLHADCGDGTLLNALAAGGIDVYGIDPGTGDSDRAAAAGLDVRRDDIVSHLRAMPDESLAGLVLSGGVDRMAATDRSELVRLAELKLAPGACVVVVGTAPEAWAEVAGPVAADLAPAPPWHAETWVHLLSGSGFTELEVQQAGVGSTKSYAVSLTKKRIP